MGLDPDNVGLLIRHDDGDGAASDGEVADEGDPSEGGRHDGGGRDDPSETESDDDGEGTIYAYSFREAADRLEESNEEPIECLCVHPGVNGEEDDEADDGEEDEDSVRDGNDAASFRRFVAALGRRPGRGGGRFVR